MNNDAKPMVIFDAKPKNLAAGSNATITYNGYLNKQDSGNVYLHLGYTNADNKWVDVESVKMYKNDKNTYEAMISVKNKKHLNFAFYNDLGEWDNNLSQNYTLDISKRPNW